MTPASDFPSNISSELKALQSSGYDIIDFRSVDLQHEIYRIIAFKRKNILGRGSYGNVYQAYPVDPKNGAIIKTKKLALKIYRGTKHINESEAKFFNNYYHGCELIVKNSDTYMVMSHMPGKQIMASNNNTLNLNVEINQFSFSERVSLAHNIMLAMNLIHHNTPSTGEALIHGDINGANIIVNHDPITKKIDVYIIDFGLSKEIEDDPDKTQNMQMCGTPLFMANELVENEVHGIKSDIYALTPILVAIFGVNDPFVLKRQYKFWEKEYYKTPYNFEGIFENIAIPPYPFDIKMYIIKFLERMQSTEIKSRPDSDEALKFFTTLNKLCVTYHADTNHPDIYTCAAKLAIMADGLWKDETFNQEVREPSQTNAKAISATIIASAEKSSPNSPLLKKILSNEQIPLKKSSTDFFKNPKKSTADDQEEKSHKLHVLTD